MGALAVAGIRPRITLSVPPFQRCLACGKRLESSCLALWARRSRMEVKTEALSFSDRINLLISSFYELNFSLIFFIALGLCLVKISFYETLKDEYLEKIVKFKPERA